MHPFKGLICLVPPFVVAPRRLDGLAAKLLGMVDKRHGGVCVGGL